MKWFGGASVIDPFGGSGTTAVACKSIGIPCTLIEIEERYCEIAVKRLAQEILPLHAIKGEALEDGPPASSGTDSSGSA